MCWKCSHGVFSTVIQKGKSPETFLACSARVGINTWEDAKARCPILPKLDKKTK
jgi:hypothetical protein